MVKVDVIVDRERKTPTRGQLEVIQAWFKVNKVGKTDVVNSPPYGAWKHSEKSWEWQDQESNTWKISATSPSVGLWKLFIQDKRTHRFFEVAPQQQYLSYVSFTACNENPYLIELSSV